MFGFRVWGLGFGVRVSGVEGLGFGAGPCRWSCVVVFVPP